MNLILINFFSIQKIGFVKFVPNNLTSNQFHLAVSSFNGIPFSGDFVTYYTNFSTNLETNIGKQLNNNNLHWPNELTYSTHSIISPTVDEFGGLIVASGFLVPTKTNGGLWYYTFTSADRSQITQNAPYELSRSVNKQHDWFYHRVKFVDINGDGSADDLITCRTYKPIFGSTQTELVAFILDNKSQTFVENVIMKGGCDIFFDIVDLDKDGRFEIVAAGFFISQLNIIYSDEKTNSFLNGNAKMITIDSNAGQLFDIKVEDLDSDNQLEILATNHQGNSNKIKGALFYYKLKGSNYRNSTWEKFMIYENFPVLKQGINQAAPGSATLIYPNLNNTKKELPYILVAGDGAEYGYLFEPSLSGSNLNYTLTWNYMFSNTVGGVSVADIDGDGFNEFIIAIYEANSCFLFSFSP